MVVECRMKNALCRAPPHTALSTPSALFDDVLDGQGERHESETDGDPYEGQIVALDLIDSFFQLWYARFSDMFSLPEPLRASEVNISIALDVDMFHSLCSQMTLCLLVLPSLALVGFGLCTFAICYAFVPCVWHWAHSKYQVMQHLIGLSPMVAVDPIFARGVWYVFPM